MTEITIDLDVKLLPQLVVFSVITESEGGGGPFIENFCCMVSNQDELKSEFDRWIAELQQDGFIPKLAVARHVPRKVYATQG